MPKTYLRQGHAAIDAPAGEPTPNGSHKNGVLRIKQTNGLTFSTVWTTLPLPLIQCAPALTSFHPVSRAVGPS